jgi:hypothetical protein
MDASEAQGVQVCSALLQGMQAQTLYACPRVGKKIGVVMVCVHLFVTHAAEYMGHT